MTAPLVSPPSSDVDSPEALAISARLTALIEHEIDAAHGWIPFSRFMELALYAPGLGYYSAGAAKVGPSPADGSPADDDHVSELSVQAWVMRLLSNMHDKECMFTLLRKPVLNPDVGRCEG